MSKARKKFRALEPIGVDNDTWLYAEQRGLCVVRMVRPLGGGEVIKSEMFFLPWRKVEQSLRERSDHAR